MQELKRSRQYKHNFKRTPRVIPDKYSIIQGLLKLNFSLDHVLRAVKVYEHNYGTDYNFNALSEIAVRLKKKDARKYNIGTINEKEEEKRTTTQYLIDDLKQNGLLNNRSLSMSVSSNVSVEPILYDFVPKKKLKRPQLLRRHTDNAFVDNNVLYQYSLQHKEKRKKRKKKQNKHRKSISKKIEFISYLSISELSSLRLFEYIDHRDFVGKFCPATIIEIDEYNEYNVKIHYDGFPDHKYDIWCNYKNEPFRFAKYRCISRRFQCINDDGKNTKNKIYKEDINVGDFVFINPLYTIFGGKWYKGIINKFDKKSDQIQIAFEPFQHSNKEHNNDYVLYWSHIDNTLELKPYIEHHPVIYESNKKLNKKKNNFSEWTTSSVLEWINKIENGKFNNEIYDDFKQKIENIALKGYELTTLNETALKFAGLQNKYDRKCIINNILNLVNKNNATKDIEKERYTKGRSNTRVLNEVMDLWKTN